VATDAKATPSTNEINEAREEIARCLRAKASDLDNEDREEIAQEAALRWTVERKARPWTYAERALGDFLRSRDRRARLIEASGDDAQIVGHASSHRDETRAFERVEEQNLKAAVFRPLQRGLS